MSGINLLIVIGGALFQNAFILYSQIITHVPCAKALVLR